MAKLDFNAAEVAPSMEPATTDIEVVAPPSLEEPKAKRGRGRPKQTEVDPILQGQQDAYKTEYAAYVTECQAYKARDTMAMQALREGCAAKKDAMSQWNAHVDRLRLSLSELRATPKPVAPVKPS